MKKRFQFKSIRSRIISGFAVAIVLMLLLSIYTIVSINKTNESIKSILEQEMDLLIVDEKLATNMNKRTSLLRGFMLYEEESYRNEFEEETALSIELENKATELSDSEELEELIGKKVAWGSLTDEILTAYDNGDMDKAREIMVEQAYPLEKELTAGFSTLANEREIEINTIGKQVIKNG